MDQQRGRSPAASHQNSSARQSHSPAPQNYQENLGQDGSGLGIDSSQLDINNQQLGNGNYSVNQGMPVYNNYVSPQPDQQQQYAQNMNFAQNQDFSQSFKQDLNQSFGQQNQASQSFSQDLLNPNLPSNFNEGDFSLYPSSAGSGEQFDPNYYPNDTSQASSNPSINPADIMSDMSSPPHVHTPPNMLRMDSQQLHSAQHSPAVNNQQYQRSPSHSRHTSLGPESAAFPQAHMHQDWGMMQNHYTGHRRTPSEYSDVSSVAPSPNIINQDSFDNIDSHSPLMNAQDSGIYEQPMLGIGNFSLSDNIQNQGMSPGHSPAVSPRLGPQQMPNFNQQNSFMLGMNDTGFAQSNQNMYQNQGPEGFPRMSQIPQMQHNNSSGEMGQAQQMIPPEINVEFAPASRQNSFEPPKPFLDQDALTPPERGRRRRAVSDPFNSGSQIARAASPAGLSPGNTSDSSLQGFSPGRSLSPLDRSGASSPLARGRRQSTSSLPNHEYILRLADPDYQAPSGTSESGSTKRVQKHPATFQCTLCPKRFTRAYNLRSHLRTHTDERPFVCTVCGKAFARQHDRKRHEGLHSGEKKFVCKGDLKQGGQWGCGRRFARADALGRHFRSEAGRICIKPLLDEEAIERQRVWHEQQMQNMAQNMQQQQPPMAVDAHGFPIDASGQYTLPAALLAQYPALATLSWAELPAGDAGIEEDISGRSSFDASGSEYYDDGDEGGYVSGPGTGFGQGQIGSDGFGVDYSSDYGGR